MNKIPESIPKQPVLKAAEDYYRLRREGIGFIAKMGSRQWTDYNTHDPGITILEALCYAITDLAYRTGWDIQDLLAPETPASDPKQPFPNQAFFTAREILTVNPVTEADFRRLLIDLAGVRNAWVYPKSCGCDVGYYAKCQNGQLQLSYQNTGPKKVELNGLYDVRLELEVDSELGDLNDHKIEYTNNVFDTEDKPHSVLLELRFPDWGLANREQEALFLNSNDAFLEKNGASFDCTVKIAASKAFEKDLFEFEADFRNHWRNVFFVNFAITLKLKKTLPSGEEVIVSEDIDIKHAALRIFGDVDAKNAEKTPDNIRNWLADKTPAGFIQRYRNKLLKINEAVKDAKAALHQHRNLDEDFSRINVVNIEDIAVCADVEVKPDADIEWVQAKIWFEIEQYFNPPVPFYSLQELEKAEVPTEDIFNGPALDNGFIKAEELQNAELRTELRTSDIINRLMDIDGIIISVNQLRLSKYDTEGKVISGDADPVWNAGEKRLDFENKDSKKKTSAEWLLRISDLHQPRFYRNMSRFLFFKNGLPFKPRMDEALATLTQLRGEAERPKIITTDKDLDKGLDLPVPAGTYRNPEDYYPLQYSFPLTYGIGPEGLPSHVLPQRRAQAKQLKAYLMIFEQLVGNALAQLAHTAELFSLDPSLERTYFVKEFSDAVIQGYTELLNGLDEKKLGSITETSPEFHERRNRFLDHLMARFGEQFSEYALLLTNFQGRKVALDRLIEDKISFLKAYPLISHDRSKAFNYRDNPCSPDNYPGLKKRVSLLLGYPDLSFFWTLSPDAKTITHYQLADKNKAIWMEGSLPPANDESSANESTAQKQNNAYRKIITQMIQRDAYPHVEEEQSGQFYAKLKDTTIKDKDVLLGQHPEPFKTKAEAEALCDELAAWSANERAIIVEHLLLRPKFPGDALYPVCTEGACNICGDEDPYSFRLTYVMPGWTEPYNTNMEMRRFAENTIRQETPAHLLAKICWVDNTGFEPNPCGELILATIAELLEDDQNTAYTRDQACECAWTIFNKYTDDFKPWFDKCKTNHWLKTAWESKIADLFKGIEKTNFDCTKPVSEGTWKSIHTKLLAYFTDIALYGWQFERFEKAWCEWLEANAAIDWTEVRLQERVLAISETGLDPTKPQPSKEVLCQCADTIIGDYATDFHKLMQTEIAGGESGEALKNNVITGLKELTINDCSSLSLSNEAETKQKLDELLKGLYTSWIDVSYRLWIVVNLLSQLRNTYPGATLHDCDDGSDQNPVRLGSTALGNNPLHPFAT